MIERRILANSTPIQFAGDPGAPRAVMVIQEAFGVNDHIRSVVERFAEHGFFAAAPELFHRIGSPEISYDDYAAAQPAMASFTPDGLRDDVVGTAEYLNALGFPAGSIGVVGYCMGGTVAFYTATLGVVGASATFYGGGVAQGRFGLASLIELAPSLRCPWLGLYGDLDQSIPVEQIEQLRAATAATAQPTEIVRYPEAGHGFNCDARPNAFNAAASLDASRRTYAFFEAHLSAR
jgi:carboxymethylenebutenolidase